MIRPRLSEWGRGGGFGRGLGDGGRGFKAAAVDRGVFEAQPDNKAK